MNKDFVVHDEASNVRTAVPCVGKAIEGWTRFDRISIQLYLSIHTTLPSRAYVTIYLSTYLIAMGKEERTCIDNQ